MSDISKARILLIEDSDGDVAMMRELFKEYDIRNEVDRAANVSEALKLLSENEYDIAFVNMNLPDGNGIDVLPHIDMKRTAVSMLSGVVTDSPMGEAAKIMHECSKAGVIAFAEKPISRKAIDLIITEIEDMCWVVAKAEVKKSATPSKSAALVAACFVFISVFLLSGELSGGGRRYDLNRLANLSIEELSRVPVLVDGG